MINREETTEKQEVGIITLIFGQCNKVIFVSTRIILNRSKFNSPFFIKKIYL